MNRFLLEQDYLSQIQEDNLSQITQSASTILQQVEDAAIAEMRSYLIQRYNVNKIFSGWTSYSSGATYYADSLVLSGDSLFYAIAPAPSYINGKTYSAGDVVLFEDHTYTAQTQTCTLPNSGNAWSKGTLYSFSGIEPTDTTKWMNSDNRNKLLVMMLVDMVLYHLHSRINPRQIPTVRIVRYDGGDVKYKSGAIGWLCKVAKGELKAELPELSPSQGLSVRTGVSSIRNRNTF